MKEISELLKSYGLPTESVFLIVLVIGILVYFIKRSIDKNDKLVLKEYGILKEYARLQEEALLKAYRILYENVDLTTLPEEKFTQLIIEADNIVMEPFTKYRSDLPDDIQAKIYNDIHSVLSQFKPGPDKVFKISDDAIRELVQYKEKFHNEIVAINALVQRHLK